MNKLYKVPLFLILILFVITYWQVPFIFFLQDEWQSFGLIIDKGISLIFRGLGNGKIFHFIPIDNFLNYLSFHLFGLHYQLYNVVGLLFHLTNGIILYFLAKKLLKDNLLAFLSTILFITSSIASQLVMWPVTSLNISSLSFALLAWLITLDSTSDEYLKLSVKVTFLMLLSLLTLEYSAGLILFLPLVVFFKIKKNRLKNFLLFLLPFIIVTVLYLGLRVYPIVTDPKSPVGHGTNLESFLSEKLIDFAVRYIGQVFIPQQAVEDLALVISEKTDQPAEPLYATITLTVGGIITAILAIFLFLKIYKLKITKKSQDMITPLFFILCSSLPFLFIPGLISNFNLYPPRYLYFGLVGAVLVITLFISFVLKTNRQFGRLIILVVILYVLYNIWGNWKISENLYKEGQMRLGVLSTIKKNYPTLPKETIFYIESDNTFYGLPPNERIPPFQSGFGQTLLVWYQPSENFPKEFFQNKFLWEITEQGFKKVDDRGFGYFRDFEQMAEVVLENKLPLSAVIAFEFTSKESTLSDISGEVHDRLKGYFSNKRKLEASSILEITSHNSEDARLALDGERSTFWDSKLTYNNPQYFELDLGSSKVIAEIQVDSYNNKNQNQVGYRIISSDDRKNWVQLLRLKLIPPTSEGLVNLFFQPTKARYFRIEQVGNHEFATWVIHELSVYEVRQ